MVRKLWLVCTLALAAGFAGAGESYPGAVPPVFVVRIDGAIGPAASERVAHSLAHAAREHAQLVVLQMDTPGGLDTAMRSIVKDILASPVPVAAFVAPQGARAASAGTYILYAAHVAAMAPATNLGAATPVAIGLPLPGAGGPPAGRPANAASMSGASPDASTAKSINDATAYIRSLAQLRGRNVAWAEQAVRESVSLPASDALAARVIDLVAVDLDDLLHQLDGRELALGASGTGHATLATAHAAVVMLEPDWRARLLAAISEPSLVLMLLVVGVYGLLFEFMNPGHVAPGVMGGVSLLLALWGLQMLPVNYAGLALILLGVAFFIAEAFVPSYGALGIGGIVAFAFGGVLLIESDSPEFGIPRPLIGALALLSAAVVIGIANMTAKARRRPLVSGTPRMIGAAGEVIEVADGEGWVTVEGERWHFTAAQPLRSGQRVRVTRVDGLTLEVCPLAESISTEEVSR